MPCSAALANRTFLAVMAAAWLLGAMSPGVVIAQESQKPDVVDLSLTVAPDLPCTWPDGFPFFQINHYRRIGPTSAYNSDILTIDGNTGTQLDVPTHSVARPELKLPNSGPFGSVFTEKVPAWQFGGEACVIDCRELLDTAPDGQSPLVRKEHVIAWEREHRPLRFGDVVLFRSDYSDKYYHALPAGRRFVADPVQGTAPGWPDPDPECMHYLASRGVMALGTDSPSMGPIPDLAEPTHYAGLQHGMIWTEGVTGLDRLPTTGAFYCVLSPKHVGGPYAEGRALAIVGEPLAGQLIESARNKRVVDLSVRMSRDLPVWWPGRGVGNHRQPYYKIDFLYAPHLDLFHHTHMLDSHTGTHLVPPAYALPREGFDNDRYVPQVRQWLAEYEEGFGARGTSSVTAEQVPLEQTCGWARVIDVRALVGTTDAATWPASPPITVEHVRGYEQRHGRLNPGEIVIFYSGHTDKHFKAFPDGSACLADPLAGTSEGWPAPTAQTIVYLAERGIRCVATDGPTLGGVDPKQALFTYWAMGSRGIVGVEFLTGVGQVPEGAFFLFAPLKIRGCHGGPGRAIAIY